MYDISTKINKKMSSEMRESDSCNDTMTRMKIRKLILNNFFAW